MKPRYKFYVGLVNIQNPKTGGIYKFAFRSQVTPTQAAFPQYTAVIGPFVTKRGATFCAEHPNSLCQTVKEYEKAAKP